MSTKAKAPSSPHPAARRNQAKPLVSGGRGVTPALTAVTCLGNHPHPGTFFGDHFDAQDGFTAGRTPHRSLAERPGHEAFALSTTFTALLKTHHASQQQLATSRDVVDHYIRQGLPVPKALRRFPINPTTQKGNLAEVVLAEYVADAGRLKLPVYRLRHNPNVDQSMKGDDVLGFDLDAQPVRIVVGESKFRKTSTDAVVDDIVLALETSFRGGLPASLQFIADHAKDEALSAQIMGCARLFAQGRLRLDYVGMLLSDAKASSRIAAHEGQVSFRRLLLISLGVPDPESIVEKCFEGLV